MKDVTQGLPTPFTKGDATDDMIQCAGTKWDITAAGQTEHSQAGLRAEQTPYTATTTAGCTCSATGYDRDARCQEKFSQTTRYPQE